jgi:hypothetical protein
LLAAKTALGLEPDGFCRKLDGHPAMGANASKPLKRAHAATGKNTASGKNPGDGGNLRAWECIRRSVAVVLRLVGAFDGHSDVLRLFSAEFG